MKSFWFYAPFMWGVFEKPIEAKSSNTPLILCFVLSNLELLKKRSDEFASFFAQLYENVCVRFFARRMRIHKILQVPLMWRAPPDLEFIPLQSYLRPARSESIKARSGGSRDKPPHCPTAFQHRPQTKFHLQLNNTKYWRNVLRRVCPCTHIKNNCVWFSLLFRSVRSVALGNYGVGGFVVSDLTILPLFPMFCQRR